jgi:hypothetical protein
MRKTIATLLVTALISSSAPLLRRDSRDRGGDFGKIIKSIVRHLIPSPVDDGGTIGPPKP